MRLTVCILSNILLYIIRAEAALELDKTCSLNVTPSECGKNALCLNSTQTNFAPKCACKYGFLPDSNRLNCLLSRCDFEGYDERNALCLRQFGPGSRCNDKAWGCICDDRVEQVLDPNTQRCVHVSAMSRKLYVNEECQQIEHGRLPCGDHMYCQADELLIDETIYRCKCDFDYKESGKGCVPNECQRDGDCTSLGLTSKGFFNMKRWGNMNNYAHLVCKEGLCECHDDYEITAYRTECLPKHAKLDQGCNKDEDCGQHTVCLIQGNGPNKCVCQLGHTPDSQSSMHCLPFKCSADGDCHRFDANSKCNIHNSSCYLCPDWHQLDPTTGKCVQMVQSIGGDCLNWKPPVAAANSDIGLCGNGAECTTGGKCRCKTLQLAAENGIDCGLKHCSLDSECRERFGEGALCSKAEGNCACKHGPSSFNLETQLCKADNDSGGKDNRQDSAAMTMYPTQAWAIVLLVTKLLL